MNDLQAAIAQFVKRADPPLAVVGASEHGSFGNAMIELRDRHVLWRVIRERSVLSIAAAPHWDRTLFFDADLLKRFLGLPSAQAAPDGSNPTAIGPPVLMARSIQGVMTELEQLRQPLAAAFEVASWQRVRRELIDLGYRRDAALFGRPYPKP